MQSSQEDPDSEFFRSTGYAGKQGCTETVPKSMKKQGKEAKIDYEASEVTSVGTRKMLDGSQRSKKGKPASETKITTEISDVSSIGTRYVTASANIEEDAQSVLKPISEYSESSQQ